VYVPIYAQTEWVGLLALGPKTSGDRYFDDDLLMLSVLADQTAVALKNARLVEDLRQINRTLDDVNRHLAQMDRTKSEFIDVISHELLTPLSLIVGYNQLLLDDRATRTNEPQTRLMQGIQQGAHRMREIIDTMLDVAKIDTSTLQLQSHPISIVAPIQEVAAKLKTALVERMLTLEIRDLSNLPLLETDLEALYKVFYNLIVNAVKYTPDGGRITVSGQALAPGAMPEVPDGGLEVVIADTGIGIDPPHVDLIFAKFYQTGDVIAHSTGKTKFKGGGPGLGLAIVKGIVEAHGGKVWAESLGHDESTCPGSRFHVVLPIRQKHAKAGGNGKGKG
jgi:signal transduction histidine kinase